MLTDSLSSRLFLSPSGKMSSEAGQKESLRQAQGPGEAGSHKNDVWIVCPGALVPVALLRGIVGSLGGFAGLFFLRKVLV